MRENPASTALASVVMASVLARPGTPSSRMCPFDRRPISRLSTKWLCPTMTLPISARSVSTKRLSRSMRSLSSLMLMTSLMFDMYDLFSVGCQTSVTQRYCKNTDFLRFRRFFRRAPQLPAGTGYGTYFNSKTTKPSRMRMHGDGTRTMSGEKAGRYARSGSSYVATTSAAMSAGAASVPR